MSEQSGAGSASEPQPAPDKSWVSYEEVRKGGGSESTRSK